MNRIMKNSVFILMYIFILVYFTACAKSSSSAYNANFKKVENKTSKKTLYSELMEYKGKQSKEKIVLINKEPITAKYLSEKHRYKNVKISDDGKHVILGINVYSLFPFKLVTTIPQKEVISLDFYDNDHIFIANNKYYGIYNFKEKKFPLKYKIEKNFEDMTYSNGIIKYKWNKKATRISWDLFTTYFKINPSGWTKLGHLGNKYSNGTDIIVNDNQTYSLEIWDIDKISLLNLKTNTRKDISNIVDVCFNGYTNFITNYSFQCASKAYKIPSMEEIPYPKESKIISPTTALSNAQKNTLLILEDFKKNTIINSAYFKDIVYSSKIHNNILITNKDVQNGVHKYSIYDISKFLGDKKAIFFNHVWLEVDKIKEKNPHINEKVAIEQALGTAYKKSVVVEPSSFIVKDNTVQVTLDNLGTYTFKAEDIIKSLSNKYSLKNIKFQIQDNNMKLLSADLYPNDSGYILSYGRVPPSYKHSLNNINLKYKLTEEEEKKLQRANKMYDAGLIEESNSVMNSILKTNPIGLELKIFGKTLPFTTYSKITANTIKELKKHKLYYLDVNITDRKSILQKGALVDKIYTKDSSLQVGDIILSIDSYAVTREHDVREIIKNIEDPNNIEIEILRNKIKMNINTEAKSISMYSEKLFNTYLSYIKNAVKSKNPNIAREAYLQLESNLDSFVITKEKKEKLLLINSLTLSALGQSEQAIKNLFKYEEKFEKESIDFLIKSNNSGWAPLLEQREKLAILFDIPTSKIKPLKLGIQYDYYDINGNLKTATNSDQVIIKKLEPKLQIQPSFQKGGVLE